VFSKGDLYLCIMNISLDHCGIYKITNIVNNKSYIGSSLNIETRWKTHIRNLQSDNHKNPHLQSAFNEYGERNFICESIENLDNLNTKSEILSKMLERESYWMMYYESYNRNIGYNIRPAIKLDFKREYSKEMLEKMSKSHLGKKLSKKHRENIRKSLYKKVYQIDKNGNIVKLWNSVIEASKGTNTISQNISACCKRKVKYANGYQWCYVDNFNDFQSKLPGVEGNPIKQVKDGKIIKKWPSIKSAMKELKLNRNQLKYLLKKNKEFQYDKINFITWNDIHKNDRYNLHQKENV
jgi:group I intron endonuclease